MIVLNGEMVRENKVNIDTGLYFGRGLFETMLVTEKPIFLKEHLDRINKGLKIIGIDKKVSPEQVLDAVEKLNCRNSVLKLVVTEKNTIYSTRKNNYSEEQYKKGFNVNISSIKRNPFSRLTYLKSLNYLENILEHENCIKEGYNEVLFFNTNGKLAEGSISNVFFIKNKKIYTPSVDCGLLNGTIRNFIVSNYDVTEGQFTKEDLEEADEVFLTNSLMGVMSVTKVCGKIMRNSGIIEVIRRNYEQAVGIMDCTETKK
ncbi:aminotransferase class IV [Clostridium sp. CX1]|uniref:aminotransferase class IV n=1 Tax=Clostridium sp. CX1 TaxID=2978346 RepID=UPI0021C00585|nr:aminotransferase class IV [Clostridium sp. CX1]MCT8978066.1 aminotransferase class IV [Clostridium sp. CX1]